jgi:hypothetical protein
MVAGTRCRDGLGGPNELKGQRRDYSLTL